MRKKVPIILQLEIVECGAASLAMVMACHGKWVPLERLRSDCGISRDGSTAKGILLAARAYGFEAKGYRVEPETIAGIVPLPCVIHWNMNHFVVLKRITKKYAYINDPAAGAIKVSLSRFSESFTGIAIGITPGKDFVPSGKPVSIWPFALERLRGSGSAILFTMLASALTAVLGIFSVMFGRVFIDDLLSGNRPEWAYGFIALFLAFSFLSVLLKFLSRRTNLKIAAKFAVVSSGMFIWHALRLPVGFYSARNAGDIALRRSENDAVSNTLIQLFAPLLIDALMVAFYLYIVLQYSVLLTVIGFSALIINFAVDKLKTTKLVEVSRVAARDEGKLGAMNVAGIEMIETIKSAGAEDGFFEKWSGLHAIVNDAKVKALWIVKYVGMIPLLVSNVTNIIILLIGAYLIMHNNMTIGIFFAFQGFLAAFVTPFMKIIDARLEMEKMKISMERVQDVFNYQPDVDYKELDAGESVYKLSGKVEIKNLTFGYNKLQPPLLDNFSLTLNPGGSVALVGTSGCGKSTIAKLISNLYSPWSGEILFDGKSCDEIPREIFTSSVSVVDQDIVLFADSISANIKTWDKSIEDFEVILACRDAQIHSSVINRDGGYAGEVLEGGKNFSGGERQRLEIAGALAKEPTIIIMDEATSALDAKTEHDVIKAVRDRGVSMIVVAHRLSTIRDCDEIIVLDKGKVIQRGTHDELYGQEGKYRELVTMS